MNITVLSDGAWGSALALNLLSNGHNVTIWGPFSDYLAEMAKTRTNPRFLPGLVYPEAMQFNDCISAATKNADVILLATPTQYLRSVLQKFKPYFCKEQHLLVNVAKGIEDHTWLRISQMCEEELGTSRYVTLSGPSHAEEVFRKIPTAVVSASTSAVDASLVQKIFMNDVFRVYTSSDPIGVELGGALKNVLAIAAGVLDGMKLGDNPKAALITRGIFEMSRLGEALGGQAATFSGLSGIGDLMVTCYSGHSRNRHVGEELGRGKKLEEIIASMGMVVAEGVRTCSGAYTLARRCNLETPIIDQIHAVLYSGKDPAQAIKELMTREAKPE